MSKNYREYYEGMKASLSSYPLFLRYVVQIDHFLTGVMYLSYPCFLLFVGRNGGSLRQLFLYIAIPSFSFLVLSVVRRWLNVPRPYEKWEIEPLISKSRKGESMPSRHVFSAALIAMCVLHVHCGLGVLFLVVALMIGIIRVIGGVHYPRDVLVGFISGMLAGSLLFILS